MKLHPNDLTEVKRILQSPRLNPSKLIEVSEIMEGYGLSLDDALECAGRLIRSPASTAEQHLMVDQRSLKTLICLAPPERLDDGRIQMHFPRERPLEKFAPRSRWKPQEAIEMKRLMTCFYESPFGLWMAGETVLRAGMEEGFAHYSAADDRQLWAKEDLLLVFAKDSYLDMLEAASLTAPSGELNDDELLAPSGVLFFERERIIPSLAAINDQVPIRAIAWAAADGHLTVQVLIDGHHERNNPGRLEPPADCYAYLYQMNALKTLMRNPTAAGNESSVNTLLGYLRSMKVIAQSPATSSATVQPGLRSKKKQRKAATSRPQSIRVLSLRNAEHGRYELDAATGRKVRQHWVRGHWRNQWYRSLMDNRAKWIDGYIKGDASLGTVTGQKVYVAR